MWAHMWARTLTCACRDRWAHSSAEGRCKMCVSAPSNPLSPPKAVQSIRIIGVFIRVKCVRIVVFLLCSMFFSSPTPSDQQFIASHVSALFSSTLDQYKQWLTHAVKHYSSRRFCLLLDKPQPQVCFFPSSCMPVVGILFSHVCVCPPLTPPSPLTLSSPRWTGCSATAAATSGSIRCAWACRAKWPRTRTTSAWTALARLPGGAWPWRTRRRTRRKRRRTRRWWWWRPRRRASSCCPRPCAACRVCRRPLWWPRGLMWPPPLISSQ